MKQDDPQRARLPGASGDPVAVARVVGFALAPKRLKDGVIKRRGGSSVIWPPSMNESLKPISLNLPSARRHGD